MESGGVTIYVYLLDEGTDVWRPTQAQPVGLHLYRVSGVVPTDERWQFQPGEIVRCERRILSGKDQLVAIEKISN